MRFTAILVCLASAVPLAYAQDSAFNPYQAALDRMPIVEAEPLIVQHYGPVFERHQGFGFGKDKGDNILLEVGQTAKNYFLFCAGRLAAVSAAVTSEIAASLVNFQESDIYAGDDGLTVTLLDGDLSVTYWTSGSVGPGIQLTYPTEPFRLLDSATFCSELPD